MHNYCAPSSTLIEHTHVPSCDLRHFFRLKIQIYSEPNLRMRAKGLINRGKLTSKEKKYEILLLVAF